MVDVFEFNGLVCHCPDGWSLTLVHSESELPQYDATRGSAGNDGIVRTSSYTVNREDRDITIIVPPCLPFMYQQISGLCRRGDRQGVIDTLDAFGEVYGNFEALLRSGSSAKITGWKEHAASSWESKLREAAKNNCSDIFLITKTPEGQSVAIGDAENNGIHFHTRYAVELLMWARDNGCTIEWF